MGLEEHVECVREALAKRMVGKSYLLPQGLIEAIAKDMRESPLTVRQCMGRLVKEAWLEGVSHDGIPFGQVRIIGHVPAAPDNPDRQRWLAVMDTKGIHANDSDALAPLSVKLAPFSDRDMGFVVDGLIQLRANLSEEAGRHRFLVSAKYLMGSSKLLDELPSSALRTFGIPHEHFPNHPLYVVVAGCSAPETVVLVENPAAFELAVATSAISKCAFIATFGFGLSKSQEDYGNQLANMAKDHFASAITLTREGSSCPSAKELLNHPKITFWGDLDVAGIQIYLRLKKNIPTLRFSALYEPMLASLAMEECSHPYVLATGKARQAKMAETPKNSDQDAMALLSKCLLRGVDQEHVTANSIEAYAPFELTI